MLRQYGSRTAAFTDQTVAYSGERFSIRCLRNQFHAPHVLKPYLIPKCSHATTFEGKRPAKSDCLFLRCTAPVTCLCGKRLLKCVFRTLQNLGFAASSNYDCLFPLLCAVQYDSSVNRSVSVIKREWENQAAVQTVVTVFKSAQFLRHASNGIVAQV